MNKGRTKKFISKEELDTREKVKQMDFFDKMEYYVGYYKYHGIAAIVILGAIISLVNSFILNPPPDPILNTVFYTGYIDVIELDQFKSRLESAIEYDDEKEAVTVSNLTKTSVNASSEYNSEMALVAKVSVSEIDLIVASEEDFLNLAVYGMYLPLETYIGNNSLNVPEELLITAQNQDGSENILGIKIPDAIIKEDFEGYEIDGLYVGVVSNSNFVDNGIKALDEIGN